ncbi:glycosyltransferase [Anaeromyxobacter sp. Fw109-5]|uniref:glycosyltransferase n=1 Tax=Anaeromyxobacter sp. (strain Fw109-5) TaxID=404589 RepID=UPI0000ED8AAE|nr:cellulose synthase catalytic subunit [Anaeromyxobacter sp. Fw109-5]ABS27324.1 Cellulose synthase (UDP-forming) [Anaeromyxobacter sp. Fw109-5]
MDVAYVPRSECEAAAPRARARGDAVRNFAFQALAVLATVLGGWYLSWRWTSSLNPDAPAFSAVIAAAETLAYLGAVLFFLSIWRAEDPVVHPPPRTVNDLREEPLPRDRPIKVDVMITTFDEPLGLVRLSVRDAKQLSYPHPLTLRVYLLDDGRRPEMRAMADEEGAGYLTRATNEGYKAGNLRNGFDHTDGDLVVICDADTRLLPALLEETLGYFRDPEVAWVQTPQSFYDLDPGLPLAEWLARRARLGRVGRALGRAVEAVIGPVAIGADRLGSDPRAFYDVIQRCRNWCNAAFCCGAGSVHRREAVMEGAVTEFGAAVEAAVRPLAARVPDAAARASLETALASQAARGIELTPYEFHVSEDIYTSIRLHAGTRRWRSVYHPRVLARMLSPQDLLAWSIQRFKYASGTLDIALHDNPLRRTRLTAWQKVMYGATMYAYLAPLWIIPLVLAPIAFFFAGVLPVRAYDGEFAARVVPFLVASRLAVMVGTWGVPTWRSEQYHLASSWLNLRALIHVVARRPLRFPVTPKVATSRRSVGLAVPHLVLLAAMAVGLVYRGALVAQGPSVPGEATAYLANVFWSLHNAACLAPFVLAALLPRRAKEVGA